MIPTNQQSSIDIIRRLLTAIEFELMEENSNIVPLVHKISAELLTLANMRALV